MQSLLLFDNNNKINNESIKLQSILHGLYDKFNSLEVNTSILSVIFLNMKYGNNSGIYYSDFDCWKKNFFELIKYMILYINLASYMEINMKEILYIIMKIIFFGLGNEIILILELKINWYLFLWFK